MSFQFHSAVRVEGWSSFVVGSRFVPVWSEKKKVPSRMARSGTPCRPFKVEHGHNGALSAGSFTLHVENHGRTLVGEQVRDHEAPPP